MPHLGIAVATAVGGWMNAGLLWTALLRRGHFSSDARLLRSLPLIVLSSAIMGVVLYFGAQGLAPWLDTGQHIGIRAAALAALIGAGMVTYFAMAHLTGAFRLSDLKAAMGGSATQA